MPAYVSNTTLDAIAEELRSARRILITTHVKPDGDALGSVVALTGALRRIGREVEAWIMPPLTESLKILTRDDRVGLHGENGHDQPQDEPDRIVIVDTGAWSQLEPLRSWLEARRERVIVIDHHLRGDDVGAMLYVDPAAAAACEIVAQLIDRLPCPMDREIAEALFVGIASDTGWFRFSNTRPETHELAARLMRLDVDHAALYQRLEQGERPEKLKLLIRALDSLELIAGGKAAVMTLRRGDFAETGARAEETERFVDMPQIVGTVQVVALITESDGDLVRISLRSKPGNGEIDVNELARQFGGGGHARAAAARFNAVFDEARQRLIRAVEASFADGHSG